jgi:histidine triad (HIT) family protein
MDCLFCKIANGDGAKVFENDEMVIIRDIAPQAKLHYLVIPKKHFDDIADLAVRDPALLSRIFAKIAELKDSLGLQNGFRLITNKGEDGCQSIKHIHIHLLGGEKLSEKMG